MFPKDRLGRNTRRSPSTLPILGPLDIDIIVKKARSLRDACLIVLLYLTGRRIMEILGLRVRDFTISLRNVVSFRTFNEKNFRSKSTSQFLFEREGKFYENIQPRFDMDSISGKVLGHYVLDHLKAVRAKDENGYLFAQHQLLRKVDRPYISRQRAGQIIRAMDERLWPHGMRHIAFTRWAHVYREDPVAMHRLTFHKRFESTLKYIHAIEDAEKLKLL